MRNLVVLIQPLYAVDCNHSPRPIKEKKIGKNKQLELTDVLGMSELFRDLKPTPLATLFSCWKSHRIFFGLDYIFISFPQKRNGSVLSSWVNELSRNELGSSVHILTPEQLAQQYAWRRSFFFAHFALASLSSLSPSISQKNTPFLQAIVVLPNYTRTCENNRNYKICQLYFQSSNYFKNCFSSGSLATELRAIILQRVQSYKF